MKEAALFERVSYLSATPVEKEYWLKELEGLQEVEIV